MLEEGSLRDGSVPPKRRRKLLLAVLCILVPLSSALRYWFPSAGVHREVLLEQAVVGDLAMRMHVALAYLNETGHLPFSGLLKDVTKDELLTAERCYEDALLKGAWPIYIRRAIVIASRSDSPKVKELIMMLEKSAARPELSDAQQRDILEEAHMWQAILLAPGVPREDMEVYRRIIQRVGLGWYRHFALAILFEKAGYREQANSEIRSAGISAVVSMAVFFLSLVVRLLFFICGTVLLVMYVVWKRSKPTVEQQLELPQSHAKIVELLLDVFVFYLIVHLAYQAVSCLIMKRILVGYTTFSGARAIVAVSELGYIASGSLALAYLWFRLNRQGLKWSVIGWKMGNLRGDIVWGIAGFAAALPLMFSGALISQGLKRLNERLPATQDGLLSSFMRTSDSLSLCLFIIVLAVIAPVLEEIFFRGVLLTAFREMWGRSWAIFLSAVLFASIHMFPVDFFPVLALSLVLGVLACERGSLVPSIIAHAANNASLSVIILAFVGG